MQAVLGHELGHLVCEHRGSTPNRLYAVPPLPGVGAAAERIQQEGPRGEFSCDSAALWYPRRRGQRGAHQLAAVRRARDVDAYLQQAREYDEASEKSVASSGRRWVACSRTPTHPLPIRRVADPTGRGRRIRGSWRKARPDVE